MTDDQLTYKDLHEEMTSLRAERDAGIEQAEVFAEKVAKASALEVRKEMRWLVILSVGLNQFIGAIDLSNVSGATGVALLGAWVLKGAVTWFGRSL